MLNASKRLDLVAPQRTPISMLPEDILLIIFVMAKDQAWTDPKFVLKTITHVCRNWRFIAIHAPVLWSDLLSSRHPGWTAAALQRSGSAPIAVDIIVLDDGDNICDLTRKLLGRISNIAKLDLQGSPDRLAEAQKLIPETEAGNLKELSISCHSDRSAVDTPFLLSSTTFRHTHQLRRLFLSNVVVDFTSPLLRNLTSLIISYHRPNDAILPTWPLIFEALASMPHLKWLSLRRIFPADDTFAAVGRMEEIDLSSLENLILDSRGASGIYTFLARVHFPPLMTFQVTWAHNDLGDDQTTIFEMIASAAHAEQFGAGTSRLELWRFFETGYGSTKLTAFGCPYLVEVTMPYDTLAVGGVDVVTNFMEAMYATSIKTFKVDSDYHFNHEDILRLIDKLPLLEDVEVSYGTAWKFIEVLGMEPLAAQSESAPHICLPQLKTITWRNCDFSGSEAWVENVVTRVFSRRRGYGFGVKVLDLTENENLTSQMVCAFEQIVPEVEV